MQKRLNESLENNWHGHGLYNLLDIPHTEASNRPIPHRHTIWEITEHITYWMKTAAEILEGQPHPNPGELNDWPKTGTTEKEWNNTKTNLHTSHKMLKEAINRNHKKLDLKIPDQEFTYQYMLEGINKHNIYHTGQIILLRTTGP